MIEQLLRLDSFLSGRLTLASNSPWRRYTGLMAHLGDGPYVFSGLGLSYVLGWLFDAAFVRRAALVVVLIVLATMLSVTLIKFTVRRQRPRPPGEFVAFNYDIYSFPSGHAARLAALATGVMSFSAVMGGILWVVALAVAAARVAVGVHYISDIIAGIGIGLLIAWGSRVILPILAIPIS